MQSLFHLCFQKPELHLCWKLQEQLGEPYAAVLKLKIPVLKLNSGRARCRHNCVISACTKPLCSVGGEVKGDYISLYRNNSPLPLPSFPIHSVWTMLQHTIEQHILLVKICSSVSHQALLLLIIFEDIFLYII